MSLELIVNATQRYPVEGSVEVQEVANGAGTLTVTVLSTANAARPVIGDTAVLNENGTPISGGFVSHLTETSIDKDFGQTNWEIELTAGDFNTLMNRRYVTEDIPSGTMAAALAILRAGYLADYSVTDWGSQPAGPTLPPLKFQDTLLMEAFQQISGLTSGAGNPYFIKIDESLVLKAQQAGSVAAPFDITSDASQHLYSDITVERIREEDYANFIIVTVAPVTEPGRTESFVGDGTTGPFALTFSVTHLIGAVGLSTGGGETINNVGDPGPKQWEYDPATNTISRVAGATVIGTVYTLHFDGTFSARVTADGGAAPADRVERRIDLDVVPEGQTAQDIADAALAQLMVDTIQVSYETLSTGLRVGMHQVLTSAKRNLSGLTAVITDIHATEIGFRQLRRTVTLIADTSLTNLNRGWQDTYRQWFKTGQGGESAITANPPGVLAPGGIDGSIQFNDNGGFGGVAEFLFKKDSLSVVAGDDTDVTAASYRHCFIYGRDCHLTD